MPRPTIDLEPFKEKIVSLFREGSTSRQIARLLQEEESTTTTYHTIEQRLQQWGENKRVKTEDSDELRLRILALLYEACFDDDDI